MNSPWLVVGIVLFAYPVALVLRRLLGFLLASVDEKRAMSQFRECYRAAKILALREYRTTGVLMNESQVVSVAIHSMRLRQDVNVGRHRFGESATNIMGRIPTDPNYLVA